VINEVIEVRVQCPYCWENFTLLIDGSVDEQEYTEDCEVCCRPIDFSIAIDDDDQANVEARSQYE
jgi:hypothetical protein